MSSGTKLHSRPGDRQPSLAALPPDQSAALQALALERGDAAAARLIGLSITTYARAVAGWPLQRTTRTHVGVMLERARDTAPKMPAAISSLGRFEARR